VTTSFFYAISDFGLDGVEASRKRK